MCAGQHMQQSCAHTLVDNNEFCGSITVLCAYMHGQEHHYSVRLHVQLLMPHPGALIIIIIVHNY